MTSYWIVHASQAVPLTRSSEAQALDQYGRSRFGLDWLVLTASTPQGALEQAALYDKGQHPQQREIHLYALAYRVGGVDLPHDALPPPGKDDTV